MKIAIIAMLAAVLASAPATGTFAHDHTAHQKAHTASGMTPQSADPLEAIPALMKGIFETSDNPLTVEPVIVSGNWAVADWAQGGKGGRALLRKTDAKGWVIHLCSGASLREKATYAGLGIADSDADRLSHGLLAAEADLAPEKVALFDSFEGTMMMDKQ